MISENVPYALLYFIDILIKAGALFGELCSEVEITLICCPSIKLDEWRPGVLIRFLFTMHYDVKTVYEFLLAKCSHSES